MTLPNRPLMLACAAALAAACLSPAALAQDAADERKRIDAEQAAAEARYREREAACRKQFVVTACVNEAKAERRTVLERLRGERLLLDEQARKQRAADRLAEMEKRQQERAEAEREAAARAAQRASDPAAQASPASAPAVKVPHAIRPPSPPPDRRGDKAQAAERAARSAERASEAAEHRRKVLERNARQPAPASLPVPPSIPASR